MSSNSWRGVTTRVLHHRQVAAARAALAEEAFAAAWAAGRAMTLDEAVAEALAQAGDGAPDPD